MRLETGVSDYCKIRCGLDRERGFMRVQDLMSVNLREVMASDTVDHAEYVMSQYDISHVVVIGPNHELQGILSRANIDEMNETDKRRIQVKDMMMTDITTISSDATLQNAANLMRGKSIDCLPVVDQDGGVVGIITDTDLLDLMDRRQEGQATSSRQRRSIRSVPPGVRADIH
jgi:CBS domain-containing protein